MNGVRSMLAFWMGGANGFEGAALPPATFVAGAITIYAAVAGQAEIDAAVAGEPEVNG